MVIIFKKKIKPSLYPDEKLNKLVDRYNDLEDRIINADGDFKGYRIPPTEQNIIMSHLLNIKKSEDDKRKSAFYEDKTIMSFISVPEALKEILSFLKTIDKDLYLYALELVLGAKQDTLNIYDKYTNQDKIKSGVLADRSCNRDRGNNRIYALINERVNRKTYKRISRFVKSDRCQVSDAIMIMHEIAHSFDNPENRNYLIERKHSITTNGVQATNNYLVETTAVFFEMLFSEYLVSKYPSYKGLVEQSYRARIDNSLYSCDVVKQMTALARIKEEKGYVPGNFFEILVGPELAETARKLYLRTLRPLESRRYALILLFVPTMLKEYQKDPEAGKDKIRQYLKCCKDNDFGGALASFGMDLQDTDNYNHMLDNYREFLIEHAYPKSKYREEDRDIR